MQYSDAFIKKMNSKEAIKQLADYFDEKMGKSLVIRYNARTNWYQDIRKVFKQSLDEDKELIQYYSKFVTDKMSNDAKVIALANAVNKRLKYKADIEVHGQVEYWASAIETHRKIESDCDDYAILTCYLWGLFGIPPFRRFVRAGPVQSLDGKTRCNHATAIYMDEKHMEFFPVEGSWYPEESFKNFGKIPMRHQEIYQPYTWFLTNEVTSYSPKFFRVMFIR